MKTHGEAWLEQKLNIDLSSEYEKIKALPKRMDRSDAARHYNTKLFAYWIDKLDDSYTIAKKKAILNYLMFRHPQSKIIFKEEQ